MLNRKYVESSSIELVIHMCIYHAGSADRPTLPSALMTSPSFRGETVRMAGLTHSLSLSSRGYLETVGLESEGHVYKHTQS